MFLGGGAVWGFGCCRKCVGEGEGTRYIQVFVRSGGVGERRYECSERVGVLCCGDLRIEWNGVRVGLVITNGIVRWWTNWRSKDLSIPHD